MATPITSGPGSTSASGANLQALATAYNNGNGTAPGTTNINGQLTYTGNPATPKPPASTLPAGEQMVNGQLTYTGNTSAQPAPIANDPTAKTTPIVSANSAIQDIANKQNTTNQISQGVAGQALTVSQNRANALAGSQNTPPTPTSAPSTTNTTNGQNQPANGQNTPPDNSDLTSALTGATAALNAGNNITPPDANAEQNTQNQLSDQENDVQSQLSDINDQITQASNTFQNNISALMNGTFPLSPAQQSLINQTQSAVTGLINATQVSNQSYINGVKAFGVTAGASMYTPLQYMANINDATQNAAAKVAQVELNGAKQLSDLQQSFETEDSDLMTKSYDALQNSLTSKQKTLEDLATQVQTEAKNAQDEYDKQVDQYNTEVQNAIGNAFKADTLNEQQKNDLFNQAMQSAQFDEKQKMDLQTQWYQQQEIGLDKSKVALQQQSLGLQQDQLNATNINNSLLAANALQTAGGTNPVTGKPNVWVNGDNLDPATKAQAIASGHVVLSGDSAKAMDSVTNAQGAFGTLLSSLQNAGVINQQGQLVIGGNNKLNQLSGNSAGATHGALTTWQAGSAQPDVNNFNASIKTMISDLQKQPGTGALVSTLQNNLFNQKGALGVTVGDSPSQFQAKLTNIASALEGAQYNLLSNNITQPPQGQSLLFTDTYEPVFVPNDQINAFIQAGGHQYGGQ